MGKSCRAKNSTTQELPVILRTRNSTGWSVTTSIFGARSVNNDNSKKKCRQKSMDSKNSLLCAKDRLSLFVQRTRYGHFLTPNPHLICDSQNQVQGVFGFYDFKVQDLCSEKSSKSGFWENTKKKSRQKDYGVQKLITMR